jgi:hypothetical protein
MSSIQKKKWLSLPKYPSHLNLANFVFKAHIYQLSIVRNTGTIPPHEGEITGSIEDGKIPKLDLTTWIRTNNRLLKLGLQPPLMHSRPNLAFRYNSRQI